MMMTRADVTTYHTVGADNHQLDLYNCMNMLEQKEVKKKRAKVHACTILTCPWLQAEFMANEKSKG